MGIKVRIRQSYSITDGGAASHLLVVVVVRRSAKDAFRLSSMCTATPLVVVRSIDTMPGVNENDKQLVI